MGRAAGRRRDAAAPPPPRSRARALSSARTLKPSSSASPSPVAWSGSLSCLFSSQGGKGEVSRARRGKGRERVRANRLSGRARAHPSQTHLGRLPPGVAKVLHVLLGVVLFVACGSWGRERAQRISRGRARRERRGGLFCSHERARFLRARVPIWRSCYMVARFLLLSRGQERALETGRRRTGRAKPFGRRAAAADARAAPPRAGRAPRAAPRARCLSLFGGSSSNKYALSKMMRKKKTVPPKCSLTKRTLQT
jgi:hypothetical protein